MYHRQDPTRCACATWLVNSASPHKTHAFSLKCTPRRGQTPWLPGSCFGVDCCEHSSLFVSHSTATIKMRSSTKQQQTYVQTVACQDACCVCILSSMFVAQTNRVIMHAHREFSAGDLEVHTPQERQKCQAYTESPPARSWDARLSPCCGQIDCSMYQVQSGGLCGAGLGMRDVAKKTLLL